MQPLTLQACCLKLHNIGSNVRFSVAWSLRAGLGERLQLLVHRVDEALLVPVLFVQHAGEHVPVLRLLEFVEEQQGVLGLDAHVLRPGVAMVGEVGGPVPRDEQVQDLP